MVVKGLSLKQIKEIFLEGECLTLIFSRKFFEMLRIAFSTFALGLPNLIHCT